MNHGNRRTGGGGDHVDFPVNPQGVVSDNHGKVGGTGGHIAGALPHGVGGDHARPGITLAGCNGNAGGQVTHRIQESSALFGQYSGIVSGAQHLGENVPQLPGHPADGIEGFHHLLIVVQSIGINGEHSRGFADAHDLLAGQGDVEVACQGGQRGNVLHMRLLVQNGLIQVGNTPPLGNVEVQHLAQLGGSLAGDGVAPGAKLS